MAQQTPAPKQSSKARATAAGKAAATKANVTGYQKGQSASEDERRRMIAEEAYLIAERRGFQGDLAMNDWLQAEANIDNRFAKKH